MNLYSLPDIAAMLILMAVLGWFRSRHKDERVDGWLLGLTLILAEMIATAAQQWPHPSSHLWSPALRAAALDCYLLAAVAFGFAARRDLIPGTTHAKHFVLPAIPLFLLTTIFGFGVIAPLPYLCVIAASLVAGLIHLAFFARLRKRSRALLMAIHLTVWLPMLYLTVTGKTRWTVYWGLACLYLLVALSFRRRIRPGCIGAWVILVSFVMWAICFLAYPLAISLPSFTGLVEQIWNNVKFFVVIGMLIVLLEEETQRRKDEAMHDALTGLPNRRLFEDRLVQAIERSRRLGLSTAIFMIDLNGFKAINDTYGHQMGDVILRRTADCLKRRVRGADTLARCGGDEFTVIVNDLTRLESCARIADALHRAIEQVQVPGGLKLGGSIGYAVFPEEAEDEQTVWELADVRMYKQKRERGKAAR